MSLPTCCGNVIENYALGNKFYVYTKCKQEVTETPPTNPTVVMSIYPDRPVPIEVIALDCFEQLELFEPWLDGNTLANNKKENHGKRTP